VTFLLLARNIDTGGSNSIFIPACTSKTIAKIGNITGSPSVEQCYYEGRRKRAGDRLGKTELPVPRSNGAPGLFIDERRRISDNETLFNAVPF
jgi:hypothetical protein